MERKKLFNNAPHRRSLGLLRGGHWYTLQASRAVNQAVGRCIRHHHDYGAVILLDQRYERGEMQQSLPKWLRGNVIARGSLDYDFAVAHLREFFRGHPAKIPGATRSSGSKPRPLGEVNRVAPVARTSSRMPRETRPSPIDVARSERA